MKHKGWPSVRAGSRLRLEGMEDRSLPSGPYGPWSAAINLGGVVNTAFLDQRGTISKDGLSLYFGSNRPGSVGTIEGSDLYVTQRASVDDPWATPQKIEALSTNFDENAPTFSPDGHWVYFGSDRPGGSGGYDIWAAHRANKGDDFAWETPVNLGPIVNSSQHDDGPTFFEDENGDVSLYFTSLRSGGQGDYDIYVSDATAADHLSFGSAVNVTELNTPRRDTRTSISREGLELFITSNRVGSEPDANNVPSLDIWVATRANTTEPWGTPVNLGAPINTPANDGAPSLSFDGLTLYFDSTRPGGLGMRDLYVTTREKLRGDEVGETASALIARKAGGRQTEYLLPNPVTIAASDATLRAVYPAAPRRDDAPTLTPSQPAGDSQSANPVVELTTQLIASEGDGVSLSLEGFNFLTEVNPSTN